MSRFPNRRWLIIPASETQNIDFTQVYETSLETLRYSVDNSKTFVKYDVQVVEETYTQTFFNPETEQEETTTTEAGVYGRPSVYKPEYPEYDHEGILAELSTPEWTSPMEGE
jgi:hypothetical protein